MNGALNKVLVSVIAGLLLAAALGTYTMASRLASLEATVSLYMRTDTRRHDELAGRVRDIERERYRP